MYEYIDILTEELNLGLVVVLFFGYSVFLFKKMGKN